MLTKTAWNFYFSLFIVFLSIQSILTIQCYECRNCTDIQSCTCTNIYETNRTDVHCILLRDTLSNGVYLEIEHRVNTFSDYHIYHTHYVSVEERIAYSATTQTWSSVSHEFVYGCQTDLCNHAELLKKLPSNGLSLMLPSEWLELNLQRKPPQNRTVCRGCPDEEICANSSAALNASLCPQQECQGSCFVTEVFKNAESAQLCYASLCSDDTTFGPVERLPEVNITAFYYIEQDRFDIVEIDLACNADQCDTLDLFVDIQSKLSKNLDNIKPLLGHMNSIYSTSIFFLMMILSLQMLLLY